VKGDSLGRETDELRRKEGGKRKRMRKGKRISDGKNTTGSQGNKTNIRSSIIVAVRETRKYLTSSNVEKKEKRKLIQVDNISRTTCLQNNGQQIVEKEKKETPRGVLEPWANATEKLVISSLAHPGVWREGSNARTTPP